MKSETKNNLNDLVKNESLQQRVSRSNNSVSSRSAGTIHSSTVVSTSTSLSLSESNRSSRRMERRRTLRAQALQIRERLNKIQSIHNNRESSANSQQMN